MIDSQRDLFDEPAPEPLRGRGSIHIGTSGYSFPDWEGPFYPPKLPKREWLAYYAREFSAVEINATYYRLPPASSFAAMARNTPASCRFWVKLPGEVTHRDDSPESAMANFAPCVAPLREQGRLIGTLAQFPNSFRCNAASLDRLRNLKALNQDLPLAVELRRDEWQTPEILEFFRGEGLVNVIVDLPRIAGLPVTEAALTSPIAYYRFHGRNRATWYDPSQGDRYDYDYSVAEVTEFSALIQRLDEQAHSSYVFFNNCHMGQAIKNARMLREILGGELNSLLRA